MVVMLFEENDSIYSSGVGCNGYNAVDVVVCIYCCSRL